METNSDKYAHLILWKMAIDVVLPRLNSYIILIICPLLLILSLILGKYVYPNTVKDREYTYAKTLLITYYRESNFNKIK